MKQIVYLVGSILLVAGCGFKSDLYLPDRKPASLPEPLPELPTAPPAVEIDTPGVAVEIPPLTEPQTNKKKNQ